MRRALAVLVAAALVAAASATAASAMALPRAHAAAAGGPLVRTTLSRHGATNRLPASFMGFSVEYPGAQRFSGVPPTGVNGVFAQLADYITSTGSGPPMLRVGGGSTDESIWNPSKAARPQGITYDIDQSWVDSLKMLVSRTGMPLILGLNLAQNNPQVAIDWAREATSAFGSAIQAFEVGNEPDVYSRHPYGKDAAGNQVYARPQSYSFGQYLGEFGTFVRALHAAMPNLPLAGPSSCCERPFLDAYNFIRKFGHQVKLVTYHYYPLNACDAKPGQPGYASLGNLLSDKALIGQALRLQQIANGARRYGAGVRLTETNSAACGGKDGVSNTMGSALWGVDWLFTLWAVGVRGADFHTGLTTNAGYSPMTLGYDTSFATTVRPLYYGMLLFARATANRAKLLPKVTTGAKIRRGANVKVWGTLEGRTGHVVVLNKDARASGTVAVRARGGAATLERLSGPSMDASEGITLAGQAVPDVSRDGKLQGTQTDEPVAAKGGVYRFTLPPGSAALLTVPGVR
jgi:hypothetical protein